MIYIKRWFSDDKTSPQRDFFKCDVCGKEEWITRPYHGEDLAWFFEQFGQGKATRHALFCSKDCQHKYHTQAERVSWRIVEIDWKAE